MAVWITFYRIEINILVVDLCIYFVPPKSEPLSRTQTEPPNSTWPPMRWLCVLWLADSHLRTSGARVQNLTNVRIVAGMRGKTCFGEQSGSLLDGIEYRYLIKPNTYFNIIYYNYLLFIYSAKIITITFLQ